MNLNFKNAGKKTWNNFKKVIPILLGMLFLISLVNVGVPKEFYAKIFTSSTVLNSLIGSSAGSIAAGSPITSYIIGGELLKNGISLIAVTAFILAWVTVGLVQLPAEATLLGKKFAVLRNILSFFSAIIIAILTALSMGII